MKETKAIQQNKQVQDQVLSDSQQKLDLKNNQWRWYYPNEVLSNSLIHEVIKLS